VRALFTVLASVLLAPAALAGTICGHVSDRQTTSAVANAGVFVRTTAGAYTGLYGATNASGDFCIASIQPGTYDLEVRVDDYQVAYLRGVVVTGDVIGVDVDARMPRLFLASPVPNPARRGGTLRLRWTSSDDMQTSLAVFDARGRLVRAWTRTLLPPGEHAFEWNLRDGEGRAVSAGSYYVRLDAEGDRQVRRIVVAP
jgi:hypothetical protein